MFKKYDVKQFDYIAVLIVLALGIIGIVAIASATRIYSPEGTDVFMNRQIFGFSSGLALMMFFAFFDYKWLGKLTVPIYLFNLMLLALVLVAGDTTNNATRWILIGPVRLQPSEFAKIFIVLTLAKYFHLTEKHINNIFVILGGMLLVAIPMALIFKQPDLSTSLIMIMIFVFIIYVGGISYWYVFTAIAVAVPSAIFGFWYIQQPGQKLLEKYQVNRILSLVDPSKVDSSLLWQTNNSIMAIGSGKLFGKGLFLGKINQYDYLPEPQTDFIFSIIGEEFGFFGCALVILLIIALIIRVLWIGKDVKDGYARMIIAGYVAILTYQSFINMGVATGVVPNTGIPLPFISYGISSLWNNLIAIGIILNISMQRKKTTRESIFSTTR